MKVNNQTIIITDPCYLRHGVDRDLYTETYGYEDMSKVGFTNYISEPTLIGDWSWTAYRIKEDPIEWLEGSESDYNIEIGKFCNDSGMLFVGLLDEVVKLNPEFIKWAIKHQHCVTTISDFIGEVFIYDLDRKCHICGRGNFNFVTI